MPHHRTRPVDRVDLKRSSTAAHQPESWHPPASWPAPRPGRSGADATNTEPAPATTDAKKQHFTRCIDLRLEYWPMGLPLSAPACGPPWWRSLRPSVPRIALLCTARTYRLTRRRQITDRFTKVLEKALERLGPDQIYIRVGGILALEQIVQDVPNKPPPTPPVSWATSSATAPLKPRRRPTPTAPTAVCTPTRCPPSRTPTYKRRSGGPPTTGPEGRSDRYLWATAGGVCRKQEAGSRKQGTVAQLCQNHRSHPPGDPGRRRSVGLYGLIT
ncbi:hypothetical protein QFZ75_006540 [Streptomyces sp. V3I8]|nr:hypothetical protein [Streptomyces sp. V3I8]